MVSLEARRRGLLVLLCTAFWVMSAPSALADARSEYLVRLLQSSSQFRVRAQAAISLGNVDAERSVIDALSAALRDDHPAVRAAAANSLGRLGDASALHALEAAKQDREQPVKLAVASAIAKLSSARGRAASETVEATPPTGPPRYYVAVGRTASRAAGVSPSMLEEAQRFLREQVATIEGVLIAPDGETPTQAGGVLKRRKLRGYYLESSVTSVERRPDGGTRVAVSVIVATYPGRDMRAIMQGAATAFGSDPGQQAMSGALKSAIRQLPQALQRD